MERNLGPSLFLGYSKVYLASREHHGHVMSGAP
jgi:hypothetical protein